MDIGKIIAPKSDGQNQRIDRARSKNHSETVAARSGKRAQDSGNTDSVQISGSARNMGQVVQSYVSQLTEMDSSSQLAPSEVQDYRSRLASGALTTPAILEATASRILDGIDSPL